MIVQKTLCLWMFTLIALSPLGAIPLVEEFNRVGYLEICDRQHGAVAFDFLYACFDDLIEFLQKNPAWKQKLYQVKERFIRSKDRNVYSTDFFGLHEGSEKNGQRQISFYYSTHFHEFIYLHYPEFQRVPEITRFFETCLELQTPYATLFAQVAAELGLETLFVENKSAPPVLLKIIKYPPTYLVTRPHYDGTAFSLFLDSTDHQSLLISPYRSSFTIDDFSTPHRQFSRSDHQNSVLLIPGALLSEFSIYPTPHIVVPSGKTRYATIAFAMRPHYNPQKNHFSPLPQY